MFRSLLFSMVVFAAIISILMAALKHDRIKSIMQHALKLFLLMTGAVILGSWAMHFL
jgi:hypothetical protein